MTKEMKVSPAEYLAFEGEYDFSNKDLRFGQAFINKFFEGYEIDPTLYYEEDLSKAREIICKWYIDYE
jgi:hypothetical protein